MAFKLKRHRKSNKKSNLLKRLKELESKKPLTDAEKKEMDEILAVLNKKRVNKIESEKLNNNKQDKIAVAIYKGDSSLNDLNTGHLQSVAGSYRRGRIDNRKK